MVGSVDLVGQQKAIFAVVLAMVGSVDLVGQQKCVKDMLTSRPFAAIPNW